jgi:hypothetical protein
MVKSIKSQTATTKKSEIVCHHRLVIIDNHIVAQFQVGDLPDWYTCSKNQNSDSSCFAVYDNTQDGIRRAKALLEPCFARQGKTLDSLSIIESDLKPEEVGSGLYKNYHEGNWARKQVNYIESLTSLAEQLEDAQCEP